MAILLSCYRDITHVADKDSMLALLDKIDQDRPGREEKLKIAQQFEDLLAESSEEVKYLFKDILRCFGGKTMVNLLLMYSGLESFLVLMLIQLFFPTLQLACQALCDIPLSSFTSLSSIRTYLQDLRDYGGSREMRGHIFVI